MNPITAADVSTAWSAAEPDVLAGDARAECDCPEACRLDHERD